MADVATKKDKAVWCSSGQYTYVAWPVLQRMKEIQRSIAVGVMGGERPDLHIGAVNRPPFSPQVFGAVVVISVGDGLTDLTKKKRM